MILELQQSGARFVVTATPHCDTVGAYELHADAIGVLGRLDRSKQQVLNTKKGRDLCRVGLLILIRQHRGCGSQGDLTDVRKPCGDRVRDAHANVRRIREFRFREYTERHDRKLCRRPGALWGDS